MDISKKLQEISEGEWHEVPGTDFRLKVSQPKPIRIQALRRQCARKRSTAFPDGVDVDKLHEALLLECLPAWENLTDNGSDVPCDEANKLKLFREWPEFYTFWIQLITKVVKGSDGILEEDLGN